MGPTRDAPVLAVEGLGKSFGSVRAVDDLTFSVRPGAVTGFLGPNGAGKTTTLRMLLGLTRPTAGRALVDGLPYAEHERPARVVGAALEASSFHPGRTGLGHLEVFAAQVGASNRRCRELIDFVGLGPAAERRVGGYSMGMRQRLGLATALLADPPAVVLDEPANGLDPEGIRWMRGLLRAFAAEGRTVLISSHVLSEVQHTVDDVVIIAHGRLVHASSLADLGALATPETYVESPAAGALAGLCDDRGWSRRADGAGLVVAGVPAAEIGAAAYAAGIELHQLVSRGVGLEDVFLRLTGGVR
ncbi:ATP-binding cassette domain-containing protein [Nocardioides sp. YIM 152315]|uniref:ABC transporter ATP-binding protein n=1 Tax=Nocardioides sp. YIM 152315 TaxID=3031760 RepID=UPI0023DBC2EE|nr:ATP-binding cassette domain-containing protein [Nocardioides sp. YIM 152315]MDF1603552.1 ATP-binding cassette domain-containing protein [Nocardioides sp. YIM 152315]